MTEPEHAARETRDHSTPDARRRRLLFRATHRGTFENDLMIGGFVRANLSTLTDADLDALEALLETPDVDLADWLTGRRPLPPEAATPMMLRVRASLNA
ncbi:MAG: succinate dehydrogenase assembly factor 2 [Acetobacteraceae bacterium]|nr:succinate dehydrogenase assembly factor 2 [Acetobacteraceae bacterium]